jgi:hypothetical protein
LTSDRCPLSEVNRTRILMTAMPANDPKRTLSLRVISTLLVSSAFRQIRNRSGQIGIVDHLEAALASALTGRSEGCVFWIGSESPDGLLRWKRQKCDESRIQRPSLQRLHIAAACQILATMFVHEFMDRCGIIRHPPGVSPAALRRRTNARGDWTSRTLFLSFQ